MAHANSGSGSRRGDPRAAVQFLELLRPGGPWTLTAIDPEHPGAKTATFTDPEEARSWLVPRIGKFNLYFQANPIKRGANPSKKLGKQDIGKAEFVQVDIDRDADGVRINAPERKAGVIEQLENLDPQSIVGPPTFIIDSGNGIQALWRLETPVDLQDECGEQARKIIETMSRTTGAVLNADSCWAINHLLRLPGTINIPSAKKRAEGLIEVPTRLCSHRPDLSYCEWEFPFDKMLEATDTHDVEIGAAVDILDTASFAQKYHLPQRLVTVIENGYDPDDLDRWPSRSEAEWYVCCELARHRVPPEEIAGLLLNAEFGISARTYDDRGRTPEEHAARLAVAAHKEVAGQRVNDFDNESLDFPPPSPDAADRIVQGLSYLRADEIREKPLNPLWPGRIFIGKLTTGAGIPDQGKSVVTCDIAARVTRGADWPDGSGKAPVGKVIILSAEDDPADTIKPRLMAAGAELDKVLIVNSLVMDSKAGKATRRMFNIADDLHRLTALVRQHPNVRLLIIDPANAYMGTSKEHDSFRDSDVRAVLGPVKEWAERHEIAVLIITHFKKGGSGRAIDQVMGSLAFTALSRSAWAFIEEKDQDGAPTGRKLMAKIKQNITAPVDALAYRLVGVEIAEGITAPKVEWGEEVRGTADDLMAAGQRRKGSKSQLASLFLIEKLQDGPVAASDIHKWAKEEGHADKTLQRAKQDLDIESYQIGERGDRQWFWRLPETEDDDD